MSNLPYQNYGSPSGQSNFGGASGVKSGMNIFGGASDQSNPFGSNPAQAQGAGGNSAASALNSASAAVNSATGSGTVTNTTTTPQTDAQKYGFTYQSSPLSYGNWYNGMPVNGGYNAATNAVLSQNNLNGAANSTQANSFIDSYNAALPAYLADPSVASQRTAWQTQTSADAAAASKAAQASYNSPEATSARAQAQASSEAKAQEQAHIASQAQSNYQAWTQANPNTPISLDQYKSLGFTGLGATGSLSSLTPEQAWSEAQAMAAQGSPGINVSGSAGSGIAPGPYTGKITSADPALQSAMSQLSSEGAIPSQLAAIWLDPNKQQDFNKAWNYWQNNWQNEPNAPRYAANGGGSYVPDSANSIVSWLQDQFGWDVGAAARAVPGSASSPNTTAP